MKLNIKIKKDGAPHVHGTLWLDWQSLKKSTDFPHISMAEVEKCFKLIKVQEQLSSEQINELVKFADALVSCSLKSPRTSHIVSEVNIHHHTKTCRKHGSDCRFHFPKFPTIRTIISTPARILFPDESKRKEMVEKAEKTLTEVKTVLKNDFLMKGINCIDEDVVKKSLERKKSIYSLECSLQETAENSITLDRNIIGEDWEWMDEERLCSRDEVNDLLMKLSLKSCEDDKKVNKVMKDRLLHLLGIACAGSKEENLKNYEEALSIGQKGYGIHYKRGTDEIFVNNYNEEWMLNWNANLDFQLCLDYYSVITYITDYYAKVIIIK